MAAIRSARTLLERLEITGIDSSRGLNDCFIQLRIWAGGYASDEDGKTKATEGIAAVIAKLHRAIEYFALLETAATTPKEVIVRVDGGAVTAVDAPPGVIVRVQDHDVEMLDYEPEELKDPEDPYIETVYSGDDPPHPGHPFPTPFDFKEEGAP